MGLFDFLKNQVSGEIKQAANKVSHDATQAAKNAAQKAANDAKRKSITTTFTALPKNVNELKALPQASFKDPFGVAALAVAALCHYDENPEETFAMMDVLGGPRPASSHDKQLIRDQLGGKPYLMRSYFAGTSPENNYTPTQPYSVTFFDAPYSYDNDGYIKLNVRSSGADNPRQITLRRKGSGDDAQWFVWEVFLYPGIRIPKSEDAWA